MPHRYAIGVAILTVVVLAAACAPTGPPSRTLANPGTTGGSVQRIEDGIVRGPVAARRLALVFTGHEFAEGAPVILDALVRHRARASFFLTGTFLRTPAYSGIVERMVRDGHYVGPHSDAHLLIVPGKERR